MYWVYVVIKYVVRGVRMYMALGMSREEENCDCSIMSFS